MVTRPAIVLCLGSSKDVEPHFEHRYGDRLVMHNRRAGFAGALQWGQQFISFEFLANVVYTQGCVLSGYRFRDFHNFLARLSDDSTDDKPD